ncbi:uncharacterized protein LOC129586835 [Paramacrobiotus metropolitanus]|uniref:uncharacterized protein LOC129586835 n=1 Tax=Paramacrobiotus metropolitanus TaxID=2943436 RepID=UPI002445D342|nr:uncharacterized protein LOC129586835 [Paramacrobiotus metropolitanus]
MGKVTTTTKVLDYVIEKGSNRNIVHATVTSTPGFNLYYVKQIPAILKFLQLILAVVCAILVGYQNETRYRHQITVFNQQLPGYQFAQQVSLAGEVYFMCAHTAVIVTVLIFLITYLMSMTSQMVIAKASKLDMVMNVVLAVLLIVAGIVQLVMTVRWGSKTDEVIFPPSRPGELPRTVTITGPLMYTGEWWMRLIAGLLAFVNGMLFLVSFALARKELSGRKVVPAEQTEPMLLSVEKTTHRRT